MTDVWRIVPYAGPDALARLEADWRSLLAAMPARGPQHAFEAHRAYVTHLSRSGDGVRYFALSDGARTRAICPLETDDARLLGRSAPALGLAWRQWDLVRDVICADDEAASRLLPFLVDHLAALPESPPWLILDQVLERAALWRSVGALDPRITCVDRVGASAVFDCAVPFEDTLARLPQKMRANLRYARRRFEALPQPRYRVATGDQAAAAFDEFVALEASGWKGARGARGALSFLPDVEAFFRDLVAAAAPDCRVEVHGLYAAGACIASIVCLRGGSEVIAPKIAYDSRYAGVSPGHLLHGLMLRHYGDDAAIRVVMTVSNPTWLHSWRPTVVPAHRAYVALTPQGRAALPWLRLRRGPRR